METCLLLSLSLFVICVIAAVLALAVSDVRRWRRGGRLAVCPPHGQFIPIVTPAPPPDSAYFESLRNLNARVDRLEEIVNGS